MKIAYFEFDYHYADMVSFLDLMVNSSYTLSVFCSQEMAEKAFKYRDTPHFKWYIKKKEITLLNFFETNGDHIQTQDIIIIGTIASSFKAYYKYNFIPLTILRVHNVNAFFLKWNKVNLEFSPFYLRKAAYYIFANFIQENSLYYIPLIRKKINYFSFPEDTILEFVKKNNMVVPSRIFKVIPIATYKGENQYNANNLKIGILGLIDKRKRDYDLILSVLKILKIKKTAFLITLLGKPVGQYGKNIISSIRTFLNDTNITFKVYESYIPQEEFEVELQTINLIVAPIQKTALFGIFREDYGHTKTTGSIADMIRLGIPLVLPSFIPIDENHWPFIDRYNSVEQLAEIISKYSEQPLLLENKKLELRAYLQLNYTKEHLLKKINFDFYMPFKQ